MGIIIGMLVLGGMGKITSATEEIFPIYLDPGNGGGTIVYLGNDQTLTYAEYEDKGVNDHNGVYYILKNEVYAKDAQKVSTSIEAVGFGYVETYAAVGEKFDIGGTGSASAAIEIPVQINGWVDLGFGEASYKVKVYIKDLTTGAITSFIIDEEEFQQTGNKQVNKQILYRTPSYIFKSGHRYAVYIELTSRVYSSGGLSSASLSLNVHYDYMYIDFP
ncbi:hypothetical protein K1720_01535 [Thermococcus argininiproducens]|uniref:Uncharacterized protein n=1 Tax=Thermococcus argininiproducens TaxID=2866384 RepID=A0A9E7MBH0_9EURY|nr:hypothetical protein [Thermococcus argininiproducens]USH00187.1 hypothetical protein K1720_01535 [Thermococcus argininiproducens]